MTLKTENSKSSALIIFRVRKERITKITFEIGRYMCIYKTTYFCKCKMPIANKHFSLVDLFF